MNSKINNPGHRNQSQDIRPCVLISVLLVLIFAVVASIFLPDILERKESSPIACLDQNDSTSTNKHNKQGTKETQKNPNIRLKDAQKATADTKSSPFAIAPTGVEKIIATVTQALDNPDEDVRQSALEKLKGMRTASLNGPLQKALRDNNSEVREQALEVIGEIRSPEIIQSLETALSIGDEAMGETALDILEDIEDPRSIDVIIEFGLKDKSENIREAALNSLEYITEMKFRSYEDAKLWWSSNRDSFKF